MNTRSPAQWTALSAVMDFKYKTVLDVGCGYGDLLLYAKRAGADVWGVDRDLEIARITRKRGLPVACMDINDFAKKYRVFYNDIVFCFSVLPYLTDLDKTLANLVKIAGTAFIECQLEGDGPGYFADEEALRDKLLEYWPKVSRIGETRVKIRNTVRAIWMCEHVA